MKTLTFAGESYEAERIVKTTDSISGYIGTDEVFAFRGISDFSAFVLDGEWDPATQTPEEMLEELKQLRKRVNDAEQAVFAMPDFLL